MTKKAGTTVFNRIQCTIYIKHKNDSISATADQMRILVKSNADYDHSEVPSIDEVLEGGDLAVVRGIFLMINTKGETVGSRK